MVKAPQNFARLCVISPLRVRTNMSGQLSDDGNFMWNGNEWVPVEQAPAPVAATPAMAEPVAAAPAMAEPVAAAPAMAEPVAAAPAMAASGGDWRILMAESGLQMFFIKIGCFLVNCVTLFLAVPWTTTMYYTNWTERVVLGGRKLRFTGSAGGFFMVWLKTLGLSMITLSIYYWIWGRKNVARWVDSNIQWA
ncbi:MAG: hypothetical protein CMB52_00045 [Euryarchaeota archaeon]|nr:hypothetical protein [Euryarchaeota archaeon]|tara:strand:- start:3909 stop:4487 length:579 start_codon:yes stop_codon:yes gene_type:complete